jgi:flagellar biogenesis protein FliO
MAYLAARILSAPAQIFFLKMIFAVVFIMGLAFIFKQLLYKSYQVGRAQAILGQVYTG